MDMKEIRFTMMLAIAFAIVVGYLTSLCRAAYILAVITILYPLINIWEDKNDSK